LGTVSADRLKNVSSTVKKQRPNQQNIGGEIVVPEADFLAEIAARWALPATLRYDYFVFRARLIASPGIIPALLPTTIATGLESHLSALAAIPILFPVVVGTDGFHACRRTGLQSAENGALSQFLPKTRRCRAGDAARGDAEAPFSDSSYSMEPHKL
jgi:hypothetical protein